MKAGHGPARNLNKLFVFTAAPHIPGSGAARRRGAAGENPQEAAFQ